MKRPQQATGWLLPLCLVLAFQITLRTEALQGPRDEHSGAPIQEHGGVQQSPPMVSMGSESSSALESSAALAGDDLIAAESSQPPESAEHKAYTPVVRQDPAQQMPASVAPVVYPQQAGPIQAGPHGHMYNSHAQQQQFANLQARIPNQHPQQQMHPGQKQPPFNSFMAAALAGNYGPAQQQIAAAAAASMQQQQHPHHPQQQVVHPQHVHPQHAQQLTQHQPHHGPQHLHQMVNHGGLAAQHPRVINGNNPEQAANNQLSVQESSVRQNVAPPPANFNSMLDSNSIEMADSPQSSPSVAQPQPQPQSQAMSTAASGQHPVIAASTSLQESSAATSWPLQAPDIPKIVNLEVKCEKNLMKVSIEFDKIFNGVIFSKGHYSQGQCVHVNQNSGKQQAYFDISINSCGTQGNTQNGLYGMGGNTGSGTYFENTIVIQYDPNVQEVYDHARKLRCTWHDQYEKAVTFRPFPVDMLDIVRADFAGDNVGCWMQIQVGKGPWASEVAGIVKIGQTMTMVLAIKDEENKFDMLVRNCFAHDGKRGPIELVDKSGCITRPKLMSRFTKIKNFGSAATVLSYAHFQAFKFPDSMEVHFQCTIQICRHQCPEQCSNGPNTIGGAASDSYTDATIHGTFNLQGSATVGGNPQQQVGGDSVNLRKFGNSLSSREKRDTHRHHNHHHHLNHKNGSQLMMDAPQFSVKPMTQTVGLNRVIQVVSAGDLAFAIQQQAQQLNGSTATSGDYSSSLADSSVSQLTRLDLTSQVCMSSYNFVLALVVLSLILLCSCLVAISLYMRQKSLAKRSTNKLLVPASSSSSSSSLSSSSSTLTSANSTMRHHHQVPSSHQVYHQHHNFHH